jgi:hypothetical protein
MRGSSAPKRFRVRDPQYLAHVRGMHCLLWDRDPCTCGGFTDLGGRPVTEVAHVRSRGAGGGDDQVVPLCGRHHGEQHRIGIRSFENRHGLDLAQVARQMRRRYLEEYVFLAPDQQEDRA